MVIEIALGIILAVTMLDALSHPCETVMGASGCFGVYSLITGDYESAFAAMVAAMLAYALLNYHTQGEYGEDSHW